MKCEVYKCKKQATEFYSTPGGNIRTGYCKKHEEIPLKMEKGLIKFKRTNVRNELNYIRQILRK